MQDTKDFGVTNAVYLSQGDEKTRCPGCHSNSNTRKIGVLHVQQVDRDVHECLNCHRIYSKVDGGVRSLVESVQKDLNLSADHVGFTTASTAAYTSNNTSQIQLEKDYAGNLKIKDEAVNSTIQSLRNDVQDLTGQITSMLHSFQDIARKNSELMEKLVKDPLVGMRNAINNFDLK